MIGALARRLFGSANDRYIKSLSSLVAQINELEPELEKLSPEALRDKTAEFRRRLEDGEELDDLLVEAFATVREAAKRTLGQRHFDVQLMGGMVLHEGKIAEMKTGDGKTLVATLPVGSVSPTAADTGGYFVPARPKHAYLARKREIVLCPPFRRLPCRSPPCRRSPACDWHPTPRAFAIRAVTT